ncbi:MAG TPA: SCO family protein [Woeseiaceae bacterium]|jgi:protein SCO1/2
MNLQKTTALLVLAILVIAGAALIAIGNIDRSITATRLATVLPQPMPLPDFRLIDQDGQAFDRESLRGHPSLLFFGFTHCPDICPATLQQLAVARGKLAGQQGRMRTLPDIILISVDPERDSAEILKAYTGHFGEGVIGLGGDPVELKKLASALGIFYAREESPGADYTISHSTAVLLVNADAELQALFNAPLDVDALVADLNLLTEGG